MSMKECGCHCGIVSVKSICNSSQKVSRSCREYRCRLDWRAFPAPACKPKNYTCKKRQRHGLMQLCVSPHTYAKHNFTTGAVSPLWLLNSIFIFVLFNCLNANTAGLSAIRGERKGHRQTALGGLWMDKTRKPCQPAARTANPLSHRLKQDSRAVKPLHTLRHTKQQQKMQLRLTVCAEGESRPHVCVWCCHVDPHRGSIIHNIWLRHTWLWNTEKNPPTCLLSLIRLISCYYIIELNYFLHFFSFGVLIITTIRKQLGHWTPG